MACSKKKKEERIRGGHITGSFAGGGGGGVAMKDFKGADKHNLCSWSADLAKLNP